MQAESQTGFSALWNTRQRGHLCSTLYMQYLTLKNMKFLNIDIRKNIKDEHFFNTILIFTI